MDINLNGKKIYLKEALSLGELLKMRQIKPETSIVELNNKIVKVDELDEIILKENDSLEVLRFVGGG